jgi:chlorophyll synthase
MAVPQAIVIALLILWEQPVFALILAALLAAQFWAMGVMLTDPKARAPWYNATGVSMYVSGMMISAIALRGLL